MPTVPRAERTQTTNPLNGGQMSASLPSGAFGNIDRVASVAEEFLLEEKKKADQIVSLDADNKLMELKTRIDIEVTNRKGQEAFGAMDYATAEWNKGLNEIEKGLASEGQKRSFKNRGVAHWGELNGKILRHTDSEGRAYDKANTDAWYTNTVKWAENNYQDPEIVRGSIEAMDAVLNDYAKRNGFGKDDEAIKLQRTENRAKVHTAIIERMIVNGEDIAAKDYYEANKGDFASPELEGKIAKATTEGNASRAVTEVWTAKGPKKPGDPVNVFKMTEAIREQYGDDQDTMKAAVAELKERATLWGAEVTQNEEANSAAVWRAVEQGAGISQIRSMREYRDLDGKTQVSIIEHITDRTYALVNRKDEKPNDNQWAAYWQYSQPDTLNAMSEDQVQNLLPTLGRNLANKLMEAKRAMGSAGTIEATIDTDLFKELADEAGLPAYSRPGTLSKKATAELGSLRAAVETSIAAEQKTRGRKLTRDEKEGLMRRVIGKTVTMSGLFSNTEKPAATIRPEDINKIIVPDADRAAIKEALKKHGKPVTEAEIKKLYFRKVNLGN